MSTAIGLHENIFYYFHLSKSRRVQRDFKVKTRNSTKEESKLRDLSQFFWPTKLHVNKPQDVELLSLQSMEKYVKAYKRM